MRENLLTEALDMAGLDPADLARRIGWTPWRASRLRHGAARLSEAEALAVGALLGPALARIAYGEARRRGRRSRAIA
jgi:plasmid maintenance system antidote protein VapI